MKTLACSIGICVYNEEQNIERLLNTLFAQRLKTVSVKEVVIVASGTTDKTVSIVNRFSRKYKHIKLIRERKRQGKASAVNKFLDAATTDILVLVGGDLLLTQLVVQELVGKFRENDVGMTGAHPVPIGHSNRIAAKAGRLLWDLHHRISLEHPKMGEVVAFRKIFKRIPLLSSVDEANIEPLIRGQGYEILYVPRAIVRNKAPATISDFVKQRRRIYNGHLAVKHEQSYEVSTYKLSSISHALWSLLKENPRLSTILLIGVTAGLEGYSRLLGWWDYHISKRRHTVWEISASTKNLS